MQGRLGASALRLIVDRNSHRLSSVLALGCRPNVAPTQTLLLLQGRADTANCFDSETYIRPGVALSADD
jgi:hypothetical protein